MDMWLRKVTNTPPEGLFQIGLYCLSCGLSPFFFFFFFFFFFCIGFLESINNMLTSGMVPALFSDDEKEAIIGNVRETSDL